MREVKKILLSKLQNIEVPILLKQIIKILEKHNPNALHLEDIFNLLLKQVPIATTLTRSYGKHPKTPELARLHKKRLKYATLINMQVKSLEKVDDKEIQSMAIIAKILPKQYLTYLGQKSNGMVGYQINNFFLHLDVTEQYLVREAFVGLGLQPYLDELNKTNIEYYNLFNKRAREIKERHSTDNPVIKKETLKLIQMFFDQVNSNQRIYKDIDYSSLIYVLNLQLAKHSKTIKTRIATHIRRSKKKASDISKNKADDDTTQKQTIEKEIPIKGLINILKDANKKEKGGEGGDT